ncbi:hypothetical protein ACHAXM_000668 [Skeletonema potamos]
MLLCQFSEMASRTKAANNKGRRIAANEGTKKAGSHCPQEKVVQADDDAFLEEAIMIAATEKKALEASAAAEDRQDSSDVLGDQQAEVILCWHGYKPRQHVLCIEFVKTFVHTKIAHHAIETILSLLKFVTSISQVFSPCRRVFSQSIQIILFHLDLHLFRALCQLVHLRFHPLLKVANTLQLLHTSKLLLLQTFDSILIDFQLTISEGYLLQVPINICNSFLDGK